MAWWGDSTNNFLVGLGWLGKPQIHISWYLDTRSFPSPFLGSGFQMVWSGSSWVLKSLIEMQSTSGFQLSILQTWSSCHESKVSSSVYLQKCISLISQAFCIVHCISLQCVITARLSAKTTAASHVAKQEAPWLSCKLFEPLMIHIVMRNYLIELWAVEQVFAKAVVLDLEFIIGEYPWLNNFFKTVLWDH